MRLAESNCPAERSSGSGLPYKDALHSVLAAERDRNDARNINRVKTIDDS